MKISSVKSFNGVESSASNEDVIGQRLPRPICWHEGMLLSPHHFQQNHQYWEGQLRRVVASLSAYYWGISELSLDYNALLEGEINIQRLLAILPDGLVVDYDNTVDDPLEISLGELSQSPVTIQLVVPIQVPGSASERSEIQRYFSRNDQPRIDENTGDNEIVMPRLIPKLALQIGDRVSSRYVGLPLFRVVKPEGGNLQLDPSYSPPLISIGADEFRESSINKSTAKSIQQRAKNLAGAIRYKAMQLAGISEEGESLGRVIAQRHHSWIRALVKELPSFELTATNEKSSPQDLYTSLVRVAGAISELSVNSIPPRFTPYCHDDNLPGFNQVLQYIKTQIDQVNLSYTTVSFDEKREGLFTLLFDKTWVGKDLIIELRPASSGNREEVSEWLKASRIASESRYKFLAKRRLLGASTEAIENDSKHGIVPAPGNAMFKIKVDKRFIVPNERLVITANSLKVKNQYPSAILVHIPH